ncbi:MULTISPECIES: GntR family transcriptional regulator [Gordonia]|nr:MULTISPECIES: FCD domain-containing protein [Gordonia]
MSRIRREHFPAVPAGGADPVLPLNAVLLFVHLEPGRSVLVFHSGAPALGRSRRSPASTREVSDAVEVLLCGAMCVEEPEPEAQARPVELLRRATDRVPRGRAATIVVDFELDQQSATWVRRNPGIRAVVVAPRRWLELLSPMVTALDPRQLPELLDLQEAVRAWFRGERGAFGWSRGERTSDSDAEVRAVVNAAHREKNSVIVVSGLCEAIADGDLHAGRVINLRAMVTRTGLSAGALSDALRHLAEDGLVNQDRAGHFYVPAPAERDVLESYTARGLLGTALVRRLAARGDGVPRTVGEIWASIGLSVTRDVPAVTGALDLDLQDELARAADMPRIEAMFTRLTLQIRLFAAALGISYQHPVDGILVDDSKVLDAIGNSDQEAAIAAWREKIDNCIRYMMGHLANQRPRGGSPSTALGAR